MIVLEACDGKGRFILFTGSTRKVIDVKIIALFAFALFVALGLASIAPQSAEAATSTTKTSVIIGTAKFTMKLENNKAAAAFRSYLSKARTMKMEELNGNEKYRYLSKSFPTKPKHYSKVRAGDVMLYGDDCLVIFYKTHKTSYNYTKIGRLTSTKGLTKAVGKASVKVRFAKMKQLKTLANTTKMHLAPQSV